MLNARRLLARFANTIPFRMGRGRVIQGIDVRLFLPDRPHDELLRKFEVALALMVEYAPRSVLQLRRCRGVLVFGSGGPRGRWSRNGRLVKVNEEYAASSKTHPAHLAATLVHEAAHAWLEDRGVEYEAANRRRIEGVCIRAEARFASRLPGGDELARYYTEFAREIVEGSDEEWSDAAFRRNDIVRLLDAEVPRWVIRLLGVGDAEIREAKLAKAQQAERGAGSVQGDGERLGAGP